MYYLIQGSKQNMVSLFLGKFQKNILHVKEQYYNIIRNIISSE